MKFLKFGDHGTLKGTRGQLGQLTRVVVVTQNLTNHHRVEWVDMAPKRLQG